MQDPEQIEDCAKKCTMGPGSVLWGRAWGQINRDSHKSGLRESFHKSGPTLEFFFQYGLAGSDSGPVTRGKHSGHIEADRRQRLQYVAVLAAVESF